MNLIHTDHGEHLILPKKHTFIPRPNVAEEIILTGLEARFGRTFLECMIKSLSVSSCDAQDLIIHIKSDYDHELLLKRIHPLIETIISGVYDIHPVIYIVFQE